MSRSKEALLDRLQDHYKAIQPEMAQALRDQLKPMIGPLMEMVGKSEDTEKVIEEFVTEFMPMSVAMSRTTSDELYTEQELAQVVDFFDRCPWWLKKSTIFSKKHNENIHNKGSEICSRIMSKYVPEDEAEASCKTSL